ncbi:MAG: FlgD immunoglobulin-like domain containing protein [candidate division WOR-3 bacterium]
MPIATVIEDLDNNGKPDRRGQNVTVTGIVTAPDSLFDVRYTDIYVQDSTAGVNVFSFTFQNADLGDSVLVSGKVDWYRGKTELANATVTVMARGRPVPEPRVLTCAQVNAEQYEGELVVLKGIVTTATVLAGNKTYDISDSTSSAKMYVDPQTALAGIICVPDTFTLVAIKGQYTGTDTTNPLSGYQVLPRFATDFSRTASDMPVVPIESVQAPGPDGVTPRRLGQVVRVRGWVSGPASAFTSGAKSWYLQDSSAGVNVYGGTYDPAQVNWLDSLGAHWEVIGTVTEYNGLTEIADSRVAVLLDTVRNFILPRVLPFNVGLTEAMESDLVTVVGDVVQAPYSSGPGYNMTVKNGNAALAIRINNATGISTSALTKGRRIRITGIVGQYDNSEPYTSGYQLMPRFQSDLFDTSGAFPPVSGLVIDTITPNPFVPSLGQAASIQLNAPTIGYRLSVNVYDLEGRHVRELLANAPGGYYDLKWDGTDALSRPQPAGIYLVSVKAARSNGQPEVISRPVVLAVKLN